MSDGSFLLDRPPKSEQLTRAWQWIAERERGLGLLDQELAVAQAELSAAQRKYDRLVAKQAIIRAQIARDRNRLRSSLAPETLSHIFQYCVAADPYAAWKVSNVSQEWREAALAPRIWSRIAVPYERPDCDTILRLWLERSRLVCDLDITFHVIYKPQSRMPSFHALERILNILVPHMYRCQHFDFCSNMDDFIQTCLGLSFGPTPNLRTFAIREAPNHPRVWQGLVQPCRYFSLGPAPQLTSFTLHDCMTWSSPLFSNANLTSLSLVTHRIRRRLSDIWAMLQLCPQSLQKLIVRTTIDRDLETITGPVTRPSFTFPYLTYLSGNAVLLHLLPVLVAPNLSRLSVDATDGQQLLRAINVLDLKCSPPIATLQLIAIRGRLAMGSGFSLKSIRRLELIDCADVDDTLFHSLTVPMAPPSTWIRPCRTWQLPNLDTLVMRRVQDVTEDVVRRFIEARNPTIGHEVITPSGRVTMMPPIPRVVSPDQDQGLDSSTPARLRVLEIEECPKIRQPEFGQWAQERLSKIPTEKWVRLNRTPSTSQVASDYQ